MFHDSRFRFQNRSGFTLVELLVAIGIFSVVTSIAVGGFTSALRTQRQVAGLVLANSNASLVIEQMAREIRTGDTFCVSGQTSCAGSTELVFRNGVGDIVTYRWNSSAGSVERKVLGSGFQPLTADNVNVRHLTFIPFGNSSGDGYPPRITILMGVSSRASGVEGSIINIQTTVSSRQPDS